MKKTKAIEYVEGQGYPFIGFNSDTGLYSFKDGDKVLEYDLPELRSCALYWWLGEPKETAQVAV